jgi:hypothetical protein
MNDLEKAVRDPERNVLVSHVPPRFSFGDAVDSITYGAAEIGFDDFIEGQIRPVPSGQLFPEKRARELRDAGFPVKVYEKANRGNSVLYGLIDRLGVRKGVNGHFHGSVGNAHDWAGKKVREGDYSSELFWNASLAERGIVGVLTIDDVNVKHEQIRVDLGDFKPREDYTGSLIQIPHHGQGLQIDPQMLELLRQMGMGGNVGPKSSGVILA